MAGASSHVHATAIAVDGVAALLLGPSGSGKSDLALRCLMTSWQYGGLRLAVELVADDQVLLHCDGGRLHAAAPPSIAGRIEVRGLGVVPVAHAQAAVVALAVDLSGAVPPQRFPDPHPVHVVLGRAVPLIRVAPFEASAPAKVVLALARLGRDGSL